MSAAWRISRCSWTTWRISRSSVTRTKAATCTRRVAPKTSSWSECCCIEEHTLTPAKQTAMEAATRTCTERMPAAIWPWCSCWPWTTNKDRTKAAEYLLEAKGDDANVVDAKLPAPGGQEQ